MNQIKIIRKNEACPICHGEGFIYLPSGGRSGVDFLEPCRCIEEKCVCDKTPPYYYSNDESPIPRPCPCRATRTKLDLIRRKFRLSNIPKKYQYRRLSEFNLDYPAPDTAREMAIALDNIHHFITDFNPRAPGEQKGFYFHGPTGTGKTMLACLAANELILKHQIDTGYVKITRDLFNKIRASFNTESSSYGKGEDIINSLIRKDLLIIDDFGVQADSEWEKRTLYDLLDARYENTKPVLITSNHQPADWKSLFSGRIYSRLMEMTNFVEMIADDYRNRFNNQEHN